jgi:hypothetical protein
MQIQIERLIADARNPNEMRPEDLRKLATVIRRQNNQYPPLIVRPESLHKNTGRYVLVDGHQRLAALISLGIDPVECVVFQMNELEAAAALATMNRLRGVDDKRKRDRLIAELSDHVTWAELETFLPESRREFEQALERVAAGDEAYVGQGSAFNHKLTFKLDEDAMKTVRLALDRARQMHGNPDLPEGAALVLVCAEALSTWGYRLQCDFAELIFAPDMTRHNAP